MYKGLTSDEVRSLAKQYGKNELPQPKFRFFRLLTKQLKSIFIILLLLAAAVTFILGEPFDAGFMLLFVVLGARARDDPI